MTGIVGNSWAWNVNPMEVIPTGSYLTAYSGGSEEFQQTPFQELVDSIAAGKLHVQIGRVFDSLEDIVAAHQLMEGNSAGGKIVVLTGAAKTSAMH